MFYNSGSEHRQYRQLVLHYKPLELMLEAIAVKSQPSFTVIANVRFLKCTYNKNVHVFNQTYAKNF